MLTALTVAAVLGTGLIGGIFFAFSSFIMPALSARTAPEGIAAMQSINVKVLSLSFLGTFFGTALACIVIVVLALIDGGLSVGVADGQPGTLLRVIGSASYLMGTLGVTIACNVPRNDALARLEPEGDEAESAWASYNQEWTAWNTVRTLAAILAMGALIGSLLQA